MNLEDLDDVIITDPQAGHTLKKVAEGWVNQPACAKDEEPGIPEPPDDGNAYLRKYEEWIKHTDETSGGPTGIPEAPSDGSLYGRNGLQQQWLPITNTGNGTTYKAGYGLQLNDVSNEFTIDTSVVQTKSAQDYKNLLDFLPAGKTPEEITDWKPIFQDAVNSDNSSIFVPYIGKDYEFKSTVVIKDKFGFNLISGGHVVIKLALDHVHANNENDVAVNLFDFQNCQHVEFRNFYLEGRSKDGFTGHGQAVRFTGCRNVLVAGCEFYNWHALGLVFVGMNGGGGRGYFVQRCLFQNIGMPIDSSADRKAAVTFSPAQGALRNMVVAECGFQNIGLDFISFGGSRNIRILNNICINNYAGGIYNVDCSNSIIKGNVVIDSGGSGIDIANCEEVIISNNTVSNCNSCGIGVFATDDTPGGREGRPYTFNINVSDNVVYNNSRFHKTEFGEGAFRGGINLTINGQGDTPGSLAQFRRITISGNVVYDDNLAGNRTQTYAIGTMNDNSFQPRFLDIRIDESNVLQAYANNPASGQGSVASREFQTSAFGIQPYGHVYQINNGETIILGYVNRAFWHCDFYETRTSQPASFMVTWDQAPVLASGNTGTWANSNTNGKMCLIRENQTDQNGNDVNLIKLVNRTGSNSYVWMKGMLS